MDGYIPIRVGSAIAESDFSFLRDDTGDNISEKNSNYAELTAQYWVWKNYDLSDVDYVWFCHYRRYMTYLYRPNIFNYLFAKNFYTPTEWKGLFIRKIIAFREHHCLKKFNKSILLKNSKKVGNYIKNGWYDVYMPKKNKFLVRTFLKKLWIKSWNNKSMSFWNLAQKNELIEECINLFIKKYPEQKNIIEKIEEQGKFEEWYRRHLFIMKKELFMQYMQWLFDYLFELENLIKGKNLDIKTHRIGHEKKIEGLCEYLQSHW